MFGVIVFSFLCVYPMVFDDIYTESKDWGGQDNNKYCKTDVFEFEIYANGTVINNTKQATTLCLKKV